MAERQARPGPELALITVWHRNAEPGSEQSALQRSQFPVLRAGQIVPRGARRGWTRQGKPFGVREARKQDLDHPLDLNPLRQRR